MPRTHMSADARCRQLERLVREHPGSSAGDLARRTGLVYSTVKAYMTRLVRERRVEAIAEEPATPRGVLQHYYPVGQVPAEKLRAA